LGREGRQKIAFVAACLELSRARKNPEGFETHLPIGFDGTANGLQHLVLLSFDRQTHNLATERDWEAARLVNLIDGDAPQDIYLAVTQRIVELLKARTTAYSRRSRAGSSPAAKGAGRLSTATGRALAFSRTRRARRRL
jgi:DNA-directed RNA polymerase